MHLIEKKEKEMSPEEHLELEVMRSLAVGRGFNLRDTSVDFDFREGSNFSRMARCLLKRFNITFKEKADEKKMWPESEVRITAVQVQQSAPVTKPVAPIQQPITGEDIQGEEDMNVETEEATQKADKPKRTSK